VWWYLLIRHAAHAVATSLWRVQLTLCIFVKGILSFEGGVQFVRVSSRQNGAWPPWNCSVRGQAVSPEWGDNWSCSRFCCKRSYILTNKTQVYICEGIQRSAVFFFLELWLDPAAADDFQRHRLLITFYITILLIIVCQNFIAMQHSKVLSSVLLVTVFEMGFRINQPSHWEIRSANWTIQWQKQLRISWAQVRFRNTEHGTPCCRVCYQIFGGTCLLPWCVFLRNVSHHLSDRTVSQARRPKRQSQPVWPIGITSQKTKVSHNLSDRTVSQARRPKSKSSMVWKHKPSQ